MAQRGGIADALGIVAVSHADMQVHVKGFLGGTAQRLHIAVGAGLAGKLAAHHAGHPKAAACTQGLIAVHVAVVVAVVGDDRAVKAPFIAQDAGQQRLTAACPDCTDAVVAAHQTDSIVLLDEHLEGAQVGFAQGLLGHPCVDGITVDAALAIVADEMLDIGVDTGIVGALHGVAADDAGQQAVLGIILIVTAIEGAAVHVGGRGIPAGIAVLQCLRADGAALLQSKVGVPCLGQRAGAGEAGPGTHAGKAADLGGAVGILAAHLTDALKLKQTAVAVDKHVFHLVHSQLIQQGIPLRVVEVSAQLVAQLGSLAVILDLQAVLGTGGDGLIGLVDVAVRHVGGVEVQRLDIVGHSAAGGAGLGEGARKVGAGQVGDVLGGIAAVKAYAVNGIAAGELVADLAAGDTVGRILHIGGQRAGQRCLLGIVHGVGIVAHGKDIVTGVQLIPGKAVVVGIVGIVAGHLLHGDSQGDLLALAGLQLLGLGKGGQLNAGFLDFASRIRGGVVQLYNILARAVAGVGNGDLDRHIAVLGQGAAIGGGIGHSPVKAGVGQAVAEGVLHNAVIAGAVLVGNIAPVALGVSGFVPFVADVNALGVIHIGDLLIGIGCIEVAAGGAVRRVQTLGIGVSAHALKPGVGVAGGGGQIIGPSVGGAAARLLLTPQNGGNDRGSPRAGQPGDQAGIHTGDGFQLTQLHHIGGVDQHDHIFVVGTDVGQQGLFLGGQFQHRAGVVHHDVAALFGALVLLLGGVVALACHTADDDHGGVGVILGVIQHGLGVVGGVVDVRLIQAAGLLGAAGQRSDILSTGLEVLVHIGQLGVVLNAVGGQGSQQIGVDAAYTAGAGAAAQPCGGCPAEHIDLFGVGAQGQGVVLVLHQHGTLGFDLCGEGLGLQLGVGDFGFGIMAAGRTDKAVDDGSHRGQEIGTGQHCDQQYRGQYQPDPMQHGMRLADFRLLRHLCFSSFCNSQAVAFVLPLL